MLGETERLRTFNLERTIIFIFSFCIGIATKLNDSTLGVLTR